MFRLYSVAGARNFILDRHRCVLLWFEMVDCRFYFLLCLCPRPLNEDGIEAEIPTAILCDEGRGEVSLFTKQKQTEDFLF